MDTKTARRAQEREDAEAAAEREQEYLTYDGIPIPTDPRLWWEAAQENA